MKLLANISGDAILDRFHILTKQAIIKAVTPVLSDITTSVNKLYPQVKSRNAKILREIIDKAEQLDNDNKRYSSAQVLSLSRKEFWTLLAKLFVVLYEFDDYYEERINYILKELHHKDLYFDDQCLPENWYPNRKAEVSTYHFLSRILLPKQRKFLDKFTRKNEN